MHDFQLSMLRSAPTSACDKSLSSMNMTEFPQYKPFAFFVGAEALL